MHFTWPVRRSCRSATNSGMSTHSPFSTRDSRDIHLVCHNLQCTLEKLRQVYDETNAALRHLCAQASILQGEYEAGPSSTLLEQVNNAASEIRKLQKDQKSTSKALKSTERRYTRLFLQLNASEMTKVKTELSIKAQRVAYAEAVSLAKDVELDNIGALITVLEKQMTEKEIQINRLGGQDQKTDPARSDESPASAFRRLGAWKSCCRMLFQKLRQAQEQVSTLQSRLRIAEKEGEALDEEIGHLEVVVEHIVKYLDQGEKLPAVRFVRGQEAGMYCIWDESQEVPVFLDIE